MRTRFSPILTKNRRPCMIRWYSCDQPMSAGIPLYDTGAKRDARCVVGIE